MIFFGIIYFSGLFRRHFPVSQKFSNITEINFKHIVNAGVQNFEPYSAMFNEKSDWNERGPAIACCSPALIENILLNAVISIYESNIL